ncbi:MAG: DUF1800 family protein [Saprospiraceae bacterium]|nr:DUF1800 family protein [Saprospiraceae bacterium]
MKNLWYNWPIFISGNWDLLPVFKAIFKSEHFYDENIIGAQIKSPMECFVDLMRSSGIPAANLEIVTVLFLTVQTIWNGPF